MIQTKVAKSFAGAEKYYLYTDFTSLHSPLLRLASYSHREIYSQVYGKWQTSESS